MQENTNAEAGPSSAAGAQPSFSQKWTWRFSRIIGRELTDEQEIELARVQEEKDYARCEQWKRDLMRKSPMIIFMLKHLDLAGCPFGVNNIHCFPCGKTRNGGFSPDAGILMCQDQFRGRKHMEETMAHEMIHAFDHCRFKVDWYNLRHHACSEVRAGSLSGDCRMMNEWGRGFRSNFSKQHQECVRRRAILSVSQHPSCSSREEAEKTVNEVFDSCFKDTRPFDEIY